VGVSHTTISSIERGIGVNSKAFVFIDGLEDNPIVCGAVTLDT